MFNIFRKKAPQKVPVIETAPEEPTEMEIRRLLWERVRMLFSQYGYDTRGNALMFASNRCDFSHMVYKRGTDEHTNFHIRWNNRGEIIEVINEKTGQVMTRNKNVPMEDLVRHYARVISEELLQLMEIDKEMAASGSLTIYGQAFNDNRELQDREMKALCRALEEDGFIVVKSDYKTGEIQLRTE